MELTELHLRPNTQRNASIGRFAVMSLHRPGPAERPRLHLAIQTDEDRDYVLYPGDTFPVRDQVWAFDRVIEGIGGRPSIVLVRME